MGKKKYEKDPAKRKARAIEIMKILELDPRVIKDYEERDIITKLCLQPIGEKDKRQYIEIIDRGLDGDPELEKIVKDLEEKYNFTVFYIMENYSEFGKLDSLLIITKYLEEWQEDEDQALYREPDGQKELFSFVINRDDDDLSEFGYIGVLNREGYLLRNY